MDTAVRIVVDSNSTLAQWINQAYMDQASWDVMMDEYGWNTVDLRDKRYDGVIHMVTAAIGAENVRLITSLWKLSDSLSDSTTRLKTMQLVTKELKRLERWISVFWALGLAILTFALSITALTFRIRFVV